MTRPGLLIPAALFFSAPVGAGLTGAGYFAALPFAGFFALWGVIMRSKPFLEGRAFVLPTLVLHLVFASMALGFGQTLRAILQVDATTPLLFWLTIALAGLALGRILWKPRAEAEAEVFLESALRKLNEFADDAEQFIDQDPDLPLKHPTEAEAAALATAYGQLDALPAGATEEHALRSILLPVRRDLRTNILLDAFLDRAERRRTRRDRHVALMLASDQRLAWEDAGNERMARVFDLIVAAADVAELAHFIASAETLLDHVPAAAGDLPAIERLLEISNQIETDHVELAEGLVGLANRIETEIQDEEDD